MKFVILRRKTNMSYKIFQHLTHTFDLPHMNFMRLKQEVAIKGMANCQARDPPNIGQPTVVLKKKLKKNGDYGIFFSIGIPSHIYGVLIH